MRWTKKAAMTRCSTAEENTEKEIAKGPQSVEARKRFRDEELQRPQDKGKK